LAPCQLFRLNEHPMNALFSAVAFILFILGSIAGDGYALVSYT
jgi:hypothetical protein